MARRNAHHSAGLYVNDTGRDNAWHLDKKVPIALIFALVVQGAGAIWWASTMSGDIRGLRSDIDGIKVEAKEKSLRFDQIVSLQAEVKGISNSVERLERNVDRLVTRDSRK